MISSSQSNHDSVTKTSQKTCFVSHAWISGSIWQGKDMSWVHALNGMQKVAQYRAISGSRAMGKSALMISLVH